MRKILSVVSIIIVIVMLSGCSNYKFDGTMNIQVEEFEHTSHLNEKITLNDLKGKPWLAMFIFTNCTTVCPPMTYNMTEIQAALEDEGLENYNLVAFSVDPEKDTPEVLSKYLSYYDIKDENKWKLLTGYDQVYIKQFAKNSFKSFVENDPNSDQVIHMSSFYLVNPGGITVKSYNGNIDVPIETIVQDMKALSK